MHRAVRSLYQQVLLF